MSSCSTISSESLWTHKRRRDSHGSTKSKQAARESKVEAARQVHLENAFNHLLELGVDAWLQSFVDDSPLSLWSNTNVSTVMASLTEKGVLSDEKHWGAVRSGLDSDLPENDVYKVVETLATQVQVAAVAVNKDAKPTTALQSTPNSPAESSVYCLAKAKPDGHFTVVRRMPKVNDPEPKPQRDSTWMDRRDRGLRISRSLDDTVAIAEYKKEKSGRPENERQLLGNVAQVMYNDPRRIFSFGITIEKTSVRLWHFNRSRICVSKEFDCEKEPYALVRVLLFLSFASQQQLGFDPTVMKGEDGTEQYFRYAVGDKWYRTVGDPIDEDGAYFLIGRGVRVWAVKECDQGGKFLSEELNVLKDAWQWDDIPTERQIQEDIMRSLAQRTKISFEDARAKLAKYFLTIIADETLTSTPKKPSEAQQISFTQRPTASLPTKSRSQRTTQSVGPHGPENGQAPAPVEQQELAHHCRTNQRHVFKEMCSTYYEVCDLRVGLEVCKGYVEGISLIRVAGYVHRDISGGNCLVYEGLPKISDLEHCKRYDSVSTHDAVTVTYQFTAVDVGLGKICFPLDKADFPSRGAYLKATVNLPHHHFHFFHDLESVFWVASHHIVNSIPDDPRNIPTVDSVKAWHTTVKRYFNDTTDSILRRQRLLEKNLDELYRALQQWWTAEVTEVFYGLFEFAEVLIAQYKALQKQPQVLLTPDALDRRWPEELFTSDAYDTLISLLDEALSSLPSKVPVLQTWAVLADLEQAAAAEGRKAKRSKLAGQ
ncbi:hypothetical protein DFP72DRAFT_955852 [Ephemerocybe angulata]|uniref:Fungal-type protein kinase domain-containing protein n=1 Tax=Ephemerocybe angulata TaxID=980116 RepID=A0A8H6MC17_9AGAR|nr:hypothetical protein DFP72DRAFT_955852 [Tulosesus angulatus]